MSRIRSIKPEFPKDEIVGAMSRDVRLLYIQLWTLVDDKGRFRAAPALIRAELYPYDEDIGQHDVAGWLQELERLGRVRFYVSDGQQYGYIPKWSEHQRIDHPSPSKFPEPTESNTVSLATPREPLVKLRESLASVPVGIGREGKGRDEEGSREPAASPRPDRPPGSTPDFPAFVDAFDSRFRLATDAKPSWGAKEGNQVKALLRRQPLDECVRRLGIFFSADRPPWLTSYDLATFLQHFDKFATATGPPKPRRAHDPQIDNLLALTGRTDDRSPGSGNLADAQSRLPAGGPGPRREDGGGA